MPFTLQLRLPVLPLVACLLTALTSCGQEAASGAPAAVGKAEVEPFIRQYFSTWSAQDMEGYGACFHPAARISFVTGIGQMSSQGLTDFLHGQKVGHQRAAEPMTEVPTDIRIFGDERAAQAQVRWKLAKGREVITGTDYFTLVKTASGWKIASLVFYND